MPYFADLFGEYLDAQPEGIRVEAIFHALFPQASDTPEAVQLGEGSFEDHRSLTLLHGVLSQLSGADLQELLDRARSGDPVSSLEGLQVLLAKEEYRTLPGFDEVMPLVPRWHAIAWYNLGVTRGEQGDLSGAVAAYERAVEIKPDYAAAQRNLATAQKALQRLKGEGDQPSTGLEERVPGWLKGLATAEELERWIYRGHEALLGPRPVAVLFDPGLVPGKDDGDRELLLLQLEEQMRSVYALPKEARFRIGLRSARSDREGEFRIIEVVRHPEAKPGPLPLGVLPLVVTEAVASPHSLFYTDPLFYADLTGLTLPQALADLTDLFA